MNVIHIEMQSVNFDLVYSAVVYLLLKEKGSDIDYQAKYK